MRLCAMMIATLLPCYTSFLLSSTKLQALMIASCLCVLVVYFSIGPTFALMQRLVVDEMPGNDDGVGHAACQSDRDGIGPQVVGILSDLLKGLPGSDSLALRDAGRVFVTLWSAYHFWQVGRSVTKSGRLRRCRLARAQVLLRRWCVCDWA